MENLGTSVGIVGAMTAATLLSRFLPFIIFRGERKTPPFVEFLGKTLPYATIGLLVVYCLRTPLLSAFGQLASGGSDLSAWGVPEAAAVLAVAVLHRWKKNSMLSIGVGTVLYMVLKQAVFV
ncbi:MAG TPA: AzlD domain-containing protein [Candidatus Lachnoclostridium pullistercoris]|uniref:AzlD domain-containing protein n=1 Tax=Candidatus Lachnoclostridium pullistercoris TaxID=2838632 RepID=A0A9D2T6M1_9FIRM|nr:AzlD domain-containing protein [Candidatus Lachnoclostridium pullistercoris]